MPRTKTKTATKARKTTKAKKATPAKTRTKTPKLIANASKVVGDKIYCVNHNENTTPYWGGKTCDNTHDLHGNQLVRWVCSDCVGAAMPAPAIRQTPKVDPITGMKRGRGRPRKNPPKPVITDENGNPVKRGRGRPKGSTKKPVVTDATPKRRGRPPGSKNKTTKVIKEAVAPKKVAKKVTTKKKAKK